MQAPWSKDEIEKRIARRIEELGAPAAVLARAKGYPKGLFEKPPEYGRRIDKLEQIAEALNWSLPELLGIAPSGEIAVSWLSEALRLAANLMKTSDPICPMRSNPLVVATTTARAYRVVRALAQGNPDFSLSEQAMQDFAEELRDILASGDSSKS